LEVSSETVTVLAKVAVAALPDVSAALLGISPETKTPIDNVPSPPVVFTIPSVVVFNAVAVAALPVVEPDDPLTFPVTSPVRFPTKADEVNAPVLGL
jgi:hypothetical protein